MILFAGSGFQTTIIMKPASYNIIMVCKDLHYGQYACILIGLHSVPLSRPAAKSALYVQCSHYSEGYQYHCVPNIDMETPLKYLDLQ